MDIVVSLMLLQLHAICASPSSSLNYCHRLDDHPPRLYATKTAYDEVRARDLETCRQLVVQSDDSSSQSADSAASQLGTSDDYSCQS